MVEIINDINYKYYVDKDAEGYRYGGSHRHYHGVVVCYCKRAPDIEINQLIEKSTASLKNSEDVNVQIGDRDIYDVLGSKYQIRAVAYCYDGDEFDVEKGKEISRKKVLKKYLKQKDKVMNNTINYIQTVLDILNSKKH